MFASNQRPTAWVRVLLVLASTLAGASIAFAEPNDREQEQIKRLKLQMRQVQQEKVSLEEAQSKAAQEKSALASSLKSAQAEASSHKASAGVSARKFAGLTAEVAALKQEKSTLSEQLSTLQKQLDDSKAEAGLQQGKAQTTSAALSGLQSKYQGLAKQHETCYKDNAALVDIGSELLVRYENKGIGEVLGAKEPFFQTARVTLENQAQAYRNKLDEVRVKP